jgi:pimeloyl-ACP methyl ester carboxylesterase
VLKQLSFVAVLVLVSMTSGTAQRGGPAPAPTVPATVERGMLRDGTAFMLAKPDNWNGTLFVSLDTPVLNAGYVTWLLQRGYAMAGNDRSQIGSLMDRAAANLVETVDLFAAKFGTPKRSIVWGVSLGGQAAAVTAYRYPTRFVGALTHCGGLMGWPAYLNTKLDVAFALKTLLEPAGSNLPLVRIPAETAPLNMAWTALIENAQKTPEGRARIALAATLGQAPAWTTRNTPEPAADDFNARQQAIYRSVLTYSGEFTALRRRLEVPAGGSTSWNTGVDYAALLAQANELERRTVQALYRQAGLSLERDLEALAKAPRVTADRAATDFVWNLYPFDGNIQMPILTMAITGDPNVWTTIDSGYEARVRGAGKQELLRMTYVHGPAHCGFTDAERVASFQTILERLDTGRWPETNAAAMNARATASGLGDARYLNFKPDRLYRAAFRP